MVRWFISLSLLAILSAMLGYGDIEPAFEGVGKVLFLLTMFSLMIALFIRDARGGETEL